MATLTQNRTIRFLHFGASGNISETFRSTTLEPPAESLDSGVREVHGLLPIGNIVSAVKKEYKDQETQTEATSHISEDFPIPPDEFTVDPETGKKTFTLTLRHPSEDLKWTIPTLPSDWRGDYSVLLIDAKMDTRNATVHFSRKRKMQIKGDEQTPFPLSGFLFPIHITTLPDEDGESSPPAPTTAEESTSPKETETEGG